MMIPKPDEIEITVFGPGYGECIVIHLGSGKWAIIDSCLDDSHEPASVSYLKDLGVQIRDSVVSVSASHWHDDHIKGLARTIEECPNARLSLGAVLRHTEFLAFLQVHEDQPVRTLDRGGTELPGCLRLINESKRSIKPLSEDTIVLDLDAGHLAHGRDVELRALSPSGRQFTDFLERIKRFPDTNEGRAKGRIAEPSRNDLSVAMLLRIGQQSVLFGADLEEVNHPQKGWRAVVEARRGRRPRSNLFKVPHHGSRSAHNQDVWNELLEDPRSIVTPWNKGGRHLPTRADLNRLSNLSRQCYVTSKRKVVPLKKRYSADVVKLINASEVKFDTTSYSSGYVTVRWVPGDESPNIQLSGGAIAV